MSQIRDATTLPSISAPDWQRPESNLPLPEELTALLPTGCYRVDHFIGQGGMGAVYKAYQIRLQRSVAIKITLRNQGRACNFEERFQREAFALATLNHPNIVSIMDYGEAGSDYLYIVMELVEGSDLLNVIQSGRTSQTLALDILPQICDALQFAHNEGIVHRDIKPSNIILTHDGRVKIADFGLAKHYNRENRHFTKTISGLGTPDYAAPEQFTLNATVDHRADIYALGVVIYQVITGHLPRGAWKPPSQRADVVSQWDAIVNRALQFDPKDRYQQVDDLNFDVTTISLLVGKANSENFYRFHTPLEKNVSPTGRGKIRWHINPITFSFIFGIILLSLIMAVAAFIDFQKPSPIAALKPTDNHSPNSLTQKNPKISKIGYTTNDIPELTYGVINDAKWKDGILILGRPGGSGQIRDRRMLSRDAILRGQIQVNFESISPQLCLRNQPAWNDGKFYRLSLAMSVSSDQTTILLEFVRNNKSTLLKYWKLNRSVKPDDWISVELHAIRDQITVVADGNALGTVNHDGISEAGGWMVFTQGRAYFRNIEYVPLDD